MAEFKTDLLKLVLKWCAKNQLEWKSANTLKEERIIMLSIIFFFKYKIGHNNFV